MQHAAFTTRGRILGAAAAGALALSGLGLAVATPATAADTAPAQAVAAEAAAADRAAIQDALQRGYDETGGLHADKLQGAVETASAETGFTIGYAEQGQPVALNTRENIADAWLEDLGDDTFKIIVWDGPGSMVNAGDTSPAAWGASGDIGKRNAAYIEILG